MEIKIEKLNLSQLSPNPDNPRQIKKDQIDKLAKSLAVFPDMMEIREIVVDENMMILGGNMRYQALKKNKEKTCIAKIVTGLTDQQKREFVIKDNSSFGDWDFDILSNTWDDLPLTDWGLDLPEEWLSHAETDRSDIDHRFDEGEKPEQIDLTFICRNRNEYKKALKLLSIDSQKQIFDVEVLFNALG